MTDPIRTKASLCTGTGSLDLATPGELQWYSEIEPAPVQMLKEQHPDAMNIGDFTQLTEPRMSEWSTSWRMGGIDLLTSGDPCQSMSAAGRQLASDDSRFLWPDVMRVIRTLRPRHLFLENVQNLRTVPLIKGGERGGVLALRLNDLREAGYAVKWTVLGACAVGAPHHRHRWFLRALHVGPDAPAAIEIKNRCGAPRSGGRVLLPTPTTADGKGGPGSSGRDGGLNLRTAVQLLPTPRATDIGTEGRRSSEGWRPQLGQAVRESWGKFTEAVALWEEVTGNPAPEPTVPAPKGGRRLNPALSEWMMGYAPGFLTDRMSRNEALKAAGNGAVVLQARAAWEILDLEKDETPTAYLVQADPCYSYGMSEHTFTENQSVTIRRGKAGSKQGTVLSVSGDQIAVKLDEDGKLVVVNASNLKAPEVPVINQTRLAEIFNEAIAAGERDVDQIANRLDEAFPGFAASVVRRETA